MFPECVCVLCVCISCSVLSPQGHCSLSLAFIRRPWIPRDLLLQVLHDVSCDSDPDGELCVADEDPCDGVKHWRLPVCVLSERP